MLYRFRPLLLTFIGVTFIAGSVLPSLADDYLKRAALEYRSKDFGDSYISAAKSSDLKHRSYLGGMAALRLNKFEEAAALLADAERKLPLIADYSAFYQAEALFKLKRYSLAYAKAASVHTSFGSSRLLRRSEKLLADILYETGDFKDAVKSYQSYIEKYPSGIDAIDANFHLARCREELADSGTARLIYRNIWLNNPASTLAEKSLERLKLLERPGSNWSQYSAEELLKRASNLYAQNRYNASLKTLEMIPAVSRSQAISDRINLQAGMAQYRLKHYKLAEKHFTTAIASPLTGVNSQARFWLAKSLDRQNMKEQALAMYLKLGDEGKKQEFADDAMIEAATLKRGLRQYAEAANLFDKATKLAPEVKTVATSLWNEGWCRYLAGEYLAAVAVFKRSLGDAADREKVLYWLGRALEKSGDSSSAFYFRKLLDEYPSGFYATWYREQRGVKDSREAFGTREPMAELPLMPGFDKPRLLASLGMLEDARGEMMEIRKKSGEKKGQFPARARVYLEMQDYSSAISLFMQNSPVAWEKKNLPIWMAGYPRGYSELISQNAASNKLSEGLIYALIRAESSFAPAVKSGAGAVGLMQMMPATAKIIAREKGEFNPLRLTVPEYNIRLGTKHLNELMKEYNGDVVYVAAAYNAGSGAVKRWRKSFEALNKDEFIESIPYKETREYVKKVYASAATYRQLYGLK